MPRRLRKESCDYGISAYPTGMLPAVGISTDQAALPDSEGPVHDIVTQTATAIRPGSLRRMIDSLILGETQDYVGSAREICVRTAESRPGRQEASLALFTYISCADALVCLEALQLWAIMLRYCPSQSFVYETSHESFLEPIREQCTSPNADRRVRARFSEVIGGALHAFPTNPQFRALWQRIKRHDDPDDGIRFSNPLFFLHNTHASHGADPAIDPLMHVEVMQRLVVSCGLANERAGSLHRILDKGTSDETEAARQDWYLQCVLSKSFIQSQLPWATVNAQQPPPRPAEWTVGHGNISQTGRTFEEQVLDMLLEANQDLNDVIQRHEAEIESRAASGPVSPAARPPSSNSYSRLRPESHATAQPARAELTQNGANPVAAATAAIDRMSLQSPPPPYTEPQRTVVNAPRPSGPTEGHVGRVDIGHQLPQSVLTYLSNRNMPQEVLYDVELALEGYRTSEWIAALKEIPGLTLTDCKAIALLTKRAMGTNVQR